MSCRIVESISTLIGEVTKDYMKWGTSTRPWFRGEPECVDRTLVPKLFRKEGRKPYAEIHMLQHFRMKAPTLGLPFIPMRNHTDQWLFLAQHVGLPTRLLDWTEGLLIALHFALYTYESGAVVWMLDPLRLNSLTVGDEAKADFDYDLTWVSRKNRPLRLKDIPKLATIFLGMDQDQSNEIKYQLPKENPAWANINKAWVVKAEGTKLPYAIPTTNIHPRMSSQMSRFTIHGELENGLSEMSLPPNTLEKYVIAQYAIEPMKDELRMLGIGHSTLIPELDGLASELTEVYY